MHEFHVTHMLTLLLTSKGPLIIHPPPSPAISLPPRSLTQPSLSYPLFFFYSFNHPL